MRWSTDRLDLIAATPQLLRAEQVSKARLAQLLEAETPEVWPPPLNDADTLQYTLRFLESDPSCAGWMTWYFLRSEGRVLVGQGGFCGRPAGGSVEVGYSILEAHQHLGYATEAVSGLIDYAFSRAEIDIDVVTAQTMPDLTPSIRVLERLGFNLVGPGAEPPAVRYALKRP